MPIPTQSIDSNTIAPELLLQSVIPGRQDNIPATPVEVEKVPTIFEDNFKAITVDVDKTPIDSLVTHIGGSSWTVNYYRQVLNDNSNPSVNMVSKNAIYQQYELIVDLELKVDTPLSTNQSDDRYAMNTVGEANLYPVFIPNVGDVFVAKTVDGRVGIFNITNTIRKSLFNSSVYTLNYSLLNFADQDEARINDLNNKVIKKYVFEKDFITHGQNPLLVEENFNLVKYLQDTEYRITDKYINDFYSDDCKTFLLPDQPFTTYDTFVASAMKKIIDNYKHPGINNVNLLSLGEDKITKSRSVMDAIINNDKNLLKTIFTEIKLVSTEIFSDEPMLNSIKFSRIKKIVYPKNIETTVANTYTSGVKIINIKPQSGQIEIDEGKNNIKLISSMVSKSKAGLNAEISHHCFVDDSYIFSKAFYSNNIDEMSFVEKMLMDYFENKKIDINVFKNILDTYDSWSNVNRFYLTCVLIILIRYTIRTV